jgi:hypothetical protein
MSFLFSKLPCITIGCYTVCVTWQEKFEAPYAGFDFPFYLVQGNHDNSWMLPGMDIWVRV